jgi:hypothetical protein
VVIDQHRHCNSVKVYKVAHLSFVNLAYVQHSELRQIARFVRNIKILQVDVNGSRHGGAGWSGSREEEQLLPSVGVPHKYNQWADTALALTPANFAA